ncbi:MAG: hypothetical protein IJI60_03635 [Bacilli bacterium]|nr:hypothetical protein [Bacilli bacterium]
MKWMNKIIQGFSFLLLTGLIVALAISFNLRNLLVDEIVIETITEKITNKEYKEGNIVLDEEIEKIVTEEKVKELLKTKEIQDLVEKYIDITLNTIIEEDDLDEVELEKDILEYLSDNKEVISEVVGQEVTDEMLEQTKEQFQGKDMSKSFKQTIKNMKENMTKEEKRVIKGYRLITSSTFQWTIFGMIVTTLIALAILQKSFTKWIDTLGKSMVISGVMLFIMSIVVSRIVSSATAMKNFKISSLSCTGLILSAVGMVIVAIYYFVSKGREKKA